MFMIHFTFIARESKKGRKHAGTAPGDAATARTSLPQLTFPNSKCKSIGPKGWDQHPLVGTLGLKVL